MIRTIGPHNPTAKIRILDLLTVGDLSRSATLDRAFVYYTIIHRRCSVHLWPIKQKVVWTVDYNKKRKVGMMGYFLGLCMLTDKVPKH
jgi:hypothetical protein